MTSVPERNRNCHYVGGHWWLGWRIVYLLDVDVRLMTMFSERVENVTHLGIQWICVE